MPEQNQQTNQQGSRESYPTFPCPVRHLNLSARDNVGSRCYAGTHEDLCLVSGRLCDILAEDRKYLFAISQAGAISSPHDPQIFGILALMPEPTDDELLTTVPRGLLERYAQTSPKFTNPHPSIEEEREFWSKTE